VKMIKCANVEMHSINVKMIKCANVEIARVTRVSSPGLQAGE